MLFTRILLIILTIVFGLATAFCALSLHNNNIETMLPKLVVFMILTIVAMPSLAFLRK